MANISTVFGEKGNGPYGKALKVRVVAADRPTMYRSKDGAEKSLLTTAVSDGETVVRAVCYDPSKFAKFQVDMTLVLRHIIRRSDSEGKTIVVTSATKAFISTPKDVSASLMEEGVRLLNPPPNETVSINAALASPMKKKISISGRIVQEEEPKEVNVRGQDVQIKIVTVEDNTGKAKVTLWRELSDSPVRPGDHVKITDVQVNVWQNKTSLSTTMRSTLERCDAPSEEMEVQVEAIGLDGDNVELFLDTEDTYICNTEILKNALVRGGVEDVEMATSSGPLHLRIRKSGSRVTSAEVLQN